MKMLLYAIDGIHYNLQAFMQGNYNIISRVNIITTPEPIMRIPQ